MTARAKSITLSLAVKANVHPSVIGYEILRRVERAELSGYPLNPRTARAVLGARNRRYLVPPGIDLFELGLLDTAGRYELLPIDVDDKPLWDEVVHLVVSDAQVERQRQILRRSYRALHAIIWEASKLESSIAEWSRRGETHPVFGMLRLETIEVWKSMRHEIEPLNESRLGSLRARVVHQVAASVRAHIIGSEMPWPIGGD